MRDRTPSASPTFLPMGCWIDPLYCTQSIQDASQIGGKFTGPSPTTRFLLLLSSVPKDEVTNPSQRVGAAITFRSREEMACRFELGKTDVEIILERFAQKHLIGVRVVRSEHPACKSAESDRVVVSPGNCETDCLGEFLQIDQGWPCLDADRLSAIENFARVTGRVSNTKHHSFLPGIGIDETIVARETNRQAVGILLGGVVRNKAEALQIGSVFKRRRSLDGEMRLLEREKPGVG